MFFSGGYIIAENKVKPEILSALPLPAFTQQMHSLY